MEKEGFHAARDAARAAAADRGTRGKGGSGTKVYTQLTGPKGKVYLVEEGDLGKMQTLSNETTTAGFAGLITDDISPVATLDEAEWEGWMAVIVEEENVDTLPTITPKHSHETALSVTAQNPFFIDTGATVHISPNKLDFSTLQPINPKAIKGVGGSEISAHGIGNIILKSMEGKVLTLEKALYVPKSTVRLISASRIANDSNAYFHFDNKEVSIYDRTTKGTIARGPLLKEKGLYTINLSNSAEYAYAAHQEANIETWHRRLGHANYQAVIRLARDRKIKGAPSLHSSTPPKCNSCILGKQTRTPVPKVREEGRRGRRRLEIVWADLMGPVNVWSRSGNHYILDIVDDYSNMAWSIPLKSKDDAFAALKAWELARETETGQKVGIYRTGFDGELHSNKMDGWLKSRGTSSEHSAPYTSAHIGRVE